MFSVINTEARYGNFALVKVERYSTLEVKVIAW